MSLPCATALLSAHGRHFLDTSVVQWHVLAPLAPSWLYRGHGLKQNRRNRAPFATALAGHWIISLDGKSSSWVISETKKFWKLRDGKVVQQLGQRATFGRLEPDVGVPPKSEGSHTISGL